MCIHNIRYSVHVYHDNNIIILCVEAVVNEIQMKKGITYTVQMYMYMYNENNSKHYCTIITIVHVHVILYYVLIEIKLLP